MLFMDVWMDILLGKMQYSQEHLKTMVYAKFGGQTECIMGNWKIENVSTHSRSDTFMSKDLGFGELSVKPKSLIWFASDMNILT